MQRPVTRRYQDPLDSLWIACAAKIGLQVQRSPEVYASTNGTGALTLSDANGMDADDCLAQMILHELCHSLVQGAESFAWADWGLDNFGERDDELEFSCLRVQAALLEPLGLRRVLAPTTNFRAYYDALPADPLGEESGSLDSSALRARAAFARRVQKPWAPHLGEALEATRLIATALSSSFVRHDSHFIDGNLFALTESPAPRHRSGLSLHPTWRDPTNETTRAPSEVAATSLRCESCAWCSNGNRCVLSRKRVAQGDFACEHHEVAFDCTECGACCREAYDVVAVRKKDPAVRLVPEWLTPTACGYDLKRNGTRCAALEGGRPLLPLIPATPSERGEARQVTPPFEEPSDTPFTCAIYDARPQTCRDFTRGSQNCLHARRRVGLSR